MKKLITVLALLATLVFGVQALGADVAILKSDMNANWYASLGWDFDSEYKTMVQAVADMKLSYVELSDDALAAGNFDGAKVLILNNNRLMSDAQVEAVQNFVAAGGKVFGLYQSSFRSDENTNVNPGNQYRLDTLYNIGYDNWSGSPPLNAYIKGDTSHPIWEGLPEFVPMNRYTTMVNVTLEGGTVIGEWYNSDKAAPSHVENAALIVSDGAVYSGETFFDPFVYSDPSVQQLVRNIINYLLP